MPRIALGIVEVVMQRMRKCVSVGSQVGSVNVSVEVGAVHGVCVKLSYVVVVVVM